ncbi:hypothetical protein [Methanimicrococcus hongohii]|uniref:hypothetical protein n=1 Tax=Methanimicrococcus hongohii TaxID=3028295 RepID=UPI002931EED3|nr:hypothetical protein [Methanimicrococcus sp. Hf6]
MHLIPAEPANLQLSLNVAAAFRFVLPLAGQVCAAIAAVGSHSSCCRARTAPNLK